MQRVEASVVEGVVRAGGGMVDYLHSETMMKGMAELPGAHLHHFYLKTRPQQQLGEWSRPELQVSACTCTQIPYATVNHNRGHDGS